MDKRILQLQIEFGPADPRDAITELLQVLDESPDNWQARLHLAKCYYQTGQVSNAERILIYVTKVCTDAELVERASEALQAITEELEAAGRPEAIGVTAAIPAAQRPVERKPVEVFQTYADEISPWEKKLVRKSAKKFRIKKLRISNVVPLHPGEWHGFVRGWYHYYHGRYAGALRGFRSMLRYNPKSSLAHCRAGMALLAMHEYDAALEELNRSIECDPQNSEARRVRGLISLCLGNGLQAAEDLKAYLFRDEWDYTTIVLCSFGYRQAGYEDRAIEILEEAGKRDVIGKYWLYHVIKYLHRETTLDRLLAEMTADDEGGMTELRFYVGMDYALSNNPRGAVGDLAWVVEEGSQRVLMYAVAHAQLQRIEADERGPG